MSIEMEEVEDIGLSTRNAAVEWVLFLTDGTNVPLLTYVTKLAAAIYHAHQANKKLKDRIEKIVREIRQTNATLVELMASNQEADDSLFHPLSGPLKEYSKLLLRLKKECNKWQQKGLLQKMISSQKQQGKLSQLEMEITNVRQNTLLAAIAQFETQRRAHEARVENSLETIKNVRTPQSYPKAPPSVNLPAAPRLIGRKKELRAIQDHLQTPGRIVSLVGGAGYGKSACAAAFIRDWLHKDMSNRFGIWITAETEDLLRHAYLQMCEAYSIHHDTDNDIATSQLAELVWKKLISFHGYEWMVVFDNVPEADGNMTGPQAFVPHFFPGPLTQMGNGRIIFTTRAVQYTGEVDGIGRIGCVQIGTLSMNDAVEMVLTNTHRNEECEDIVEADRASAERLVGKECLDCLAIAIITACGYIVKVRGMTIEKYVNEMNTGDGANAVRKAMEKTLMLAREEFGLGELLDTVAFLKPDDVPLVLLGGEGKTAAIAHLEELNILRRRGLNRWSIHRLHQEAARQGRTPTAALVAVSSHFSQRGWRTDHSGWRYLGEVVAHADVLCSHHEMLLSSQEDKQADSTQKNDCKTAYSILFESGGVKWQVLSDFKGALKCYDKAIGLLHHMYGADAKNADLARTLRNIGNVYGRLGRYSNALATYDEALSMQREVYGTDAKNANLANTLNSIGLVYKSLGRYDDALAKLEEALSMKCHVYGVDAKNADLARTLHSTGVYKSLGRCDDAFATFEEALSMQRVCEVYGTDAKNADLASTLHNIGVVYGCLGRYDDALAKLDEALSMQRHVYGTNAKNADLARTLNSIGSVYKHLRRYDDALTKYDEALSMQREVCGADAKNADLACTLHNIGSIYGRLGRYDDALAKYMEALSMKRHVYGADAKNADLAGTLHNIGVVYKRLGRHDDAFA